ALDNSSDNNEANDTQEKDGSENSSRPYSPIGYGLNALAEFPQPGVASDRGKIGPGSW
ncbi:unnamed protein product, partial [marine sediment metagenome]